MGATGGLRPEALPGSIAARIGKALVGRRGAREVGWRARYPGVNPPQNVGAGVGSTVNIRTDALAGTSSGGTYLAAHAQDGTPAPPPPWEMIDPPKDAGHLDHGGISSNGTPDTRGTGRMKRRALGVTRRSGAPPAADRRWRHDTIAVSHLRSRCSRALHQGNCITPGELFRVDEASFVKERRERGY